jgi:catechol 2,3-dioxygenase-like lactoylglutathione lyase family enzyme
MADARDFYEQVIRLRISKESPRRTVFEAALALEPLPAALREGEGDTREQLALDTDSTQPSFETRSAITIYVPQDDFDRIRIGIKEAGLPLSDVRHQDGRPSFRCHDPDGNVLEVRALNGASGA